MKPNTDSPAHGEPSAARPLTVGELVEHVFSGNHGFVRSVEPDGTYTVEFSGPLVNAGYHREELKPDLARSMGEDITELRAALTTATEALAFIRTDVSPECEATVTDAIDAARAVLAKTEPSKQP